MKRFLPALLIGSVSAAALVGGAHAQPAPMGPPPPLPAPMMHHAHPLMVALPGVVLSDAQKDKIHAILDANRPDPAQMNPANNPHRQLMELLQQPGEIKRSQITKLEKKIAQDDKEHLEKMVGVALAIRGVLTPQQLQQGLDNRQKLRDLHRQIDMILRPNQGPGMPPAPPALSAP